MMCRFGEEKVRKTLNFYSLKKKKRIHLSKLFHIFDKIENKNNNNNRVTHVCFIENSDSTYQHITKEFIKHITFALIPIVRNI